MKLCDTPDVSGTEEFSKLVTDAIDRWVLHMLVVMMGGADSLLFQICMSVHTHPADSGSGLIDFPASAPNHRPHIG